MTLCNKLKNIIFSLPHQRDKLVWRKIKFIWFSRVEKILIFFFPSNFHIKNYKMIYKYIKWRCWASECWRDTTRWTRQTRLTVTRCYATWVVPTPKLLILNSLVFHRHKYIEKYCTLCSSTQTQLQLANPCSHYPSECAHAL